MLSRPEMSSRVPAAASQLNLNVIADTGSPSAFVTSSPGQVNSVVRPSRKSLIGAHCASAKTTMMMT